MLVSIIIPVFNVELYLEECLNSVVNQSYEKLEILIIDDCSTDGSNLIIKKFQADKRVKVITNDHNLGLSTSRNKGLAEATGDYLTFLDSDDFLELSTIETAVLALDNVTIDVVAFNIKSFIDKDISSSLKLVGDIANDKTYCRHPSLAQTLKTGREFILTSIKERQFSVVCYGYLIKREVLKNIEFLESVHNEDELFTPSFLLSSKALKVKTILLPLYNRRVRSNSVMTNINRSYLHERASSYLKMINHSDLLLKGQGDKYIQKIFAKRYFLSALIIYRNVYPNWVPVKKRLELFKILLLSKPIRYNVRCYFESIFPGLTGLLIKNSFLRKLRALWY